MSELSTQQWTILVVMYGSLICVFSSVALLPPFYPPLAQQKGVPPIEFGFVIGIAKLTMAIASPVIGNVVNKIEPKFLYSFGLLMVGGGYIVMSFIEVSSTFLPTSFIAQIIAGLGTACITNVSAALANKSFPEAIGSVFAGIEISIGIGYVIGPLFGGILYELGGFNLPFALFGCTVLIMSLAATLFLPTLIGNSISETQVSSFKVLCIPGISLFLFCLLCVCIAFGFFMVTCVIHLQIFELTHIEVSLMFVLNSLMVCCSATFSGWLCDHKFTPQSVTLVGTVFMMMSFLLIGPAPFLPIPYTLPLAVIACILFGIGKGSQMVSTFSGVCQEAIRAGFPNNMAIHGIVSGLWNCCFSLGCFFGYIGGGALLQWVGFEWGSMCILGLETLSFFLLTIFICANPHRAKSNNEDETDPLYCKEEENRQIFEVREGNNVFSDTFDSNPKGRRYSYGATQVIATIPE
ncbi:unnamed protein product [Meganyctiphanes norvegica]|uniref:Major facilitator superfamily (MFS) profile domain-containing protein n=1 Tax=Meganyctiphanes norvegica TaxID=48144 RepID=A0AAV2Q9F8_MEGNR